MRIPGPALVSRATTLIVGLTAVVAVAMSSAPAGSAAATPSAGTGECRGPLLTPPAPAPPGFTHHHAMVDGVRMHYLMGGQGSQVIVLLHGWPESWYEWAGIMPDLARDNTVVAVDLPGLGDSRGAPPSFDKKTLARYVHDLVTGTLGFQRVHLVGHDFGSGVAFAYAGFYGQTAADVTVMDFPIAGPGTNELLLRGALWWFGFHDVQQLPEQMVSGRQRTYLSWFFTNVVAPGNRISPRAVTEYVRTYCQPGVLHDGFELYRTVDTDTVDNTTLTTNKIAKPMLVLAGLRPGDPEAQKQQALQEVQPMVSGPIDVQLVPGAGHFLPEENPAFVLAQLRSFIDG